jgi:hypothetical protein
MGVFDRLLGRSVKKENDENDADYDAVSSVVYRRLDGMVSILSGDEQLDVSLARLNDLHVRAYEMEDKKARKAYLYWIPWFEKKAREYKKMNAQSRAMRLIEPKVPRP